MIPRRRLLKARKPDRKRRDVSGFKNRPATEIELRIETADGTLVRTRRERVVDVVLITPTGEEWPL